MDREEHLSDKITYLEAGVSCFEGQKNGKFKAQFFLGSFLVKIPACI